MRVTSTLFLIASLVTAIAVAACGSSGGNSAPPGGTGPGLNLFSGEYHAVALGAELTTGILAVSQWGFITSNGVGGVTGLLRYNNNGILGGPAGVDPGTTYGIGPGHVYTWNSGSVVYHGGISADGRVAAAAADQAGATPAVLLYAKRQGTYTPASLDGVWHMCGVILDPGPDANWSLVGPMTFDSTTGMGLGVGTITSNQDGGILTGQSIGGAYTVAADGTVTLGFGPDVVSGGIAQGGNLIVLAGCLGGGEPDALVILVRQTAGATLATMTGTYHIVGLERDAGLDYDCIRGTVTSDGAGNVTTAFTRNDSGTIVTDPPGAATYTIAADGTLAVATGGTLMGGVGPGGNVAVLGGETTAGSNPQIFLVFR